VKSQKQVHEGVLGRVRLAAKYASQLFMNRIRSLMAKKGYREEAADLIAGEIVQDPSLLARTIAEEEHGLREEAIEKPVSAGLYTGIAYFISSLIRNTLPARPPDTSIPTALDSGGWSRPRNNRIHNRHLSEPATQEKNPRDDASRIRISSRDIHDRKNILHDIRDKRGVKLQTVGSRR